MNSFVGMNWHACKESKCLHTGLLVGGKVAKPGLPSINSLNPAGVYVFCLQTLIVPMAQES